MNFPHKLAIISALCGGLAACAQTEIGSDLPDAGDDASVVVPVNPRPDMRQPVQPLPDAGGTDAAAPVCLVNDTTCLDPSTVGRCRPDQQGYDPMPCAEGEFCSAGACGTEPATTCTPGALDCLDETTTLRCRQSGDGYVQMTCEAPFKCAEGMCTDKLPTGAGCTVDDECASGNCRCGSGTDDNCPASLGGGICANTSCTATSCGVSGYCLASGSVPTGASDYDHCVQGCDGRACPTGSRCVSVPVHRGGAIEYRNACYFSGVKGFGDDCASDAECLTGSCLLNYYNRGMCSRRCDGDGMCTGDAACVQLIPGQYWCSQKCGDGSVIGTDPCPLDVPTERFDVTCKPLEVNTGGVMRVCATP